MVGKKLADFLIEERKKQSSSHVSPVICFFGDLGAGKTTCIATLIRTLGISGRILSPTFLLMRRYTLEKYWEVLYHIDLYRMTSQSEIDALGIEQVYKDSKVLMCIEWAERLQVLPLYRIEVHITEDETKRMITIQAYE